MHKAILLLTATASLTMPVIRAEAAIGWNLKDLFASFADNWTTFVLWTQADRDAIRAGPKTPLLASRSSLP
jgi:hypothetical protein